MNKKVMIFGSYVTDLCCRSKRFPTLGETVKGESFHTGPGGKGSNQAVAAHRAGTDVIFVTKLGDDALGREAMKFYQDENMNTDTILVEKNGDTGAAMIMVDAVTAQNQIIVYGGACGRITPEETKRLLPLLDQCDLFLTQLETNLEPVYELLKYAHDHGIQTVVDPAPASQVDPSLWQYIDTVKPNETEAAFFTGIKVETPEDASKAADQFQKWGVKNVIITLGEKGAYVRYQGNETVVAPICCGETVDTTGAGDAFSGGFVAALSKGLSFVDAVRYASVTAGLSITKSGTAPAMPYEEDIDRILAQTNA